MAERGHAMVIEEGKNGLEPWKHLVGGQYTSWLDLKLHTDEYCSWKLVGIVNLNQLGKIKLYIYHQICHIYISYTTICCFMF